MPADYKRYGIAAETRYAYEKFDERFDVAKNPNEPRRAGYVVEIDPSNAQSVPVKRTALGRIKHENAAVVIARDGRVVVYMGDDERGEFLYKFVSKGIYVPAATPPSCSTKARSSLRSSPMTAPANGWH